MIVMTMEELQNKVFDLEQQNKQNAKKIKRYEQREKLNTFLLIVFIVWYVLLKI